MLHAEQHKEELIFISVSPFRLSIPYRIWGEKDSCEGNRHSYSPLTHEALKTFLQLSTAHLPFATLFLPCLGFPCGSAGKESACSVGDLGSIPGLGRSPGEGKGSVQFSRLVVSDSLQLQGLQHARPPCPSPTPGVYPNSISIESVMPSNDLILCCALLLLPSIFPSIRVFSNESVLHIRWPKCWSFSFNISPSNEHSGLISFRMVWLDLLTVQGTLKSLL